MSSCCSGHRASISTHLLRTHLLELRNINKQYGLNRVLNDVSFHVGRAEILALLGDNGAGKSSVVGDLGTHAHHLARFITGWK